MFFHLHTDGSNDPAGQHRGFLGAYTGKYSQLLLVMSYQSRYPVPHTAWCAKDIFCGFRCTAGSDPCMYDFRGKSCVENSERLTVSLVYISRLWEKGLAYEAGVQTVEHAYSVYYHFHRKVWNDLDREGWDCDVAELSWKIPRIPELRLAHRPWPGLRYSPDVQFIWIGREGWRRLLWLRHHPGRKWGWFEALRGRDAYWHHHPRPGDDQVHQWLRQSVWRI